MSRLLVVTLCGLLALAASIATAQESITVHPFIDTSSYGVVVRGVSAETPAIQLELPSGLRTAHRVGEPTQNLIWRGEPVTTWRGVVEGEPESSVLLTTFGSQTAGTIHTSEGSWYVSPVEGVVPVDPYEEAHCGVEDSEVDLSGLRSVSEAMIVQPGPSPHMAVIDILAVYEPGAVVTGVTALEAELLAAVERCNTALSDSQVNAMLRLVGVELINGYNPSSWSKGDQLDYISEHSYVAVLRDEHQADTVVGIAGTADRPGGIAYQFGGNPGSSYAVVVREFVSNFVFCHEIAHTLGARHEREDYSPPPAQPMGIPDVGYAYGREIEPNYSMVTMMYVDAYGNLGTTNGEKLNLFSNRATFHAGFPTGTPSADNATVMNWAVPTVESFQQSLDCVPTDRAMCLSDGRYRVSMIWENRDGDSGEAKVGGAMTEDSGWFWFFSPNNPEIVVKVLDGCAINGWRWVFISYLTDVKAIILVEDVQTGRDWAHLKGFGLEATTGETMALPCQ